MSDNTAPRLGPSLNRLEEIVARLEGSDLELEALLALYEEGVGLVRQSRGLLKEARLTVERLRPEESE